MIFNEMQQQEIIDEFCSHLRPTLYISNFPKEIQHNIKSFISIDNEAFSPSSKVMKEYLGSINIQLNDISKKLSTGGDTSLRFEGVRVLFRDSIWVRTCLIPQNFIFIRKLIKDINHASNQINYYRHFRWPSREDERRDQVAELLKQLVKIAADNKCPNLNESAKFLILKSCELSCNGFWRWVKERKAEEKLKPKIKHSLFD